VKNIIRFIDGFLRIVRVNNLIIIFFTQYFTAVFLFSFSERGVRISEDINLMLVSLSTIIIAAAGYLINDYHDVKIDAINKPMRVLVGNVIPRRRILILYFALNSIALIIGAFISLRILAIHIFSAFSLWIYSSYLKKTAFWGNLLIAFLTSLSILIVSVYYKNNYVLVGLYACLAFFVSLIREIVKDIEDMRGDQAFGGRTLPILFGQRVAKKFIYVIAIIFISLLYYSGNLIDLWSFSIITYVIISEILLLLYFIYWADTKDKYHFCSNLCKAILLSGVISMIWVN
jgi:4-hydroxybenzoate polyprenyltransferase